MREHTRGVAARLPWLAILALAVSATAQQLPDRPHNHVVDLAGVIDAGTESRLIGYLAELEKKTGAQMIVLTVNSTGGVPIEDYALRTAEKWKLGRKDTSSGALIVVAVEDRKWRFEIGYGLEGDLTDGFCGQVGTEVFVPHFRQNKYGLGIFQGTVVLASRVASKAGVTIEGMPFHELKARPKGDGSGSSALRGLFTCIVFVIVISSMFGRGYHVYRHRRSTGGLWLWLLLGGMGSGGRGWGGGGGFGGGGFGGGGSFGGGGGGGFGGGGASGGW